MARRSHHVACVTDDRDAVVRFLTEVVGLEAHGELHAPPESCSAILGWPEDNPGADGTMLGEGPGGLVEVIEIPAALRDRVQPNISLASFATPDLEDRVEAARRSGAEVSDVIGTEELGLQGSVARVGGIAFELLRFGA